MLKFLLVVALLALATYLAVRAVERRGLGPTKPTRRPQPRIAAPDDDEDFLRELERRRRKHDDPETG